MEPKFFLIYQHFKEQYTSKTTPEIFTISGVGAISGYIEV
jgi:hypothetical protein